MLDVEDLEHHKDGALADMHEHIVSEAVYLAEPADVLRDLRFGYAGLPQNAAERV